MTDVDGRVVVLHGVNMVAKRPPYVPATLGFGEDDARFLANNGFRAVRLGVIWKGLEPTPGRYDDRYLDRIDQTVMLLARYGIYTLIDFHEDALNERFGGEGFPDWAVEVVGNGDGPDRPGPGTEAALLSAVDRFWTNIRGPGRVPLQERYAAATAHVARYFHQNQAVMGYDLINEPLPGHEPCRTAAADCSEFDRVAGKFQRRVITAIRKEDRRHLVWYEPNTLFNWGIPTRLPVMHDRRAGMSFHAYCPPALPGFGTCKQSMQQVLANAEARNAQTDDALFATEFGSQDPNVLNQFTDLADEHRMSWLAWAYCGCGAPTYPFPVSAHADDLVVDPTRAPTGANVVQGKVEALVRPHPMVVAGTPVAFAFDRATRTFTFSYTTGRADGDGRFDSTGCTEVFVPRLLYPDGYRADVRGARIVSRAGAGVVALRQRTDATRIFLRITPSKDGHTDLPTRASGCSADS